ncbi:nitronate monooxygenase [Natronocella acetinitrilica]|uniref:Nitronate monooxygenase n=1 Tax=Natronocella acetinitrilica TaxID=414046 RepID=A0AAE3G766_9GAMM|nr:nitronate monooxygenase [Natronocella acetinitrilica]MCP1676914.1 nitronate monooxygenase [Natronocella acetinitrilica]
MQTLCERLGIRYPIIQAPMAGGPTTPELVAAVSNAGGLGSFGLASTQPGDMRELIQRARALTNGPINANLFIYPESRTPDDAIVDAAIDALKPYFSALGAEPPSGVPAPYAPDFAAQLDCLFDLRPEVVTFHLAAPEAALVGRLQAAGMVVGASATSPAEARALLVSGVDFIVAQGAEAGGHRGTFLGDTESGMVGTMALTRLLVAEMRDHGTSVVAAGGIMDGAGMAAAMALGAAGVQLGTAFLACPESGASPVHKAALATAGEVGTRITHHFSGKPARTVTNRFAIDSAARSLPYLPFPVQNKLTGGLRAASARAGTGDFMSLWAGQAAALVRDLPAADLMARLLQEYDTARAALPDLQGNG